MNYEFKGCDNPKCPDKDGNPKALNIYIVPFPMKDAPDLGTKIKCPFCRKGKISRILSLPEVIVRGNGELDQTSGRSYMTNIEGKDTKITFIDHPETDPAYHHHTAEIARRNGIGGAYFNEKLGQVCVDVASSVPDPLGKMSRGSERRSEKIKVNAPTRTPPKNNSPKRPISRPLGLPVGVPMKK